MPIIPLRAFFSTHAALPELRRAVETAIRSSGFDPQLQWGDFKFRPPTSSAIKEAIKSIDAYLAAKQRGAKELAALQRAKAGLTILLSIDNSTIAQVPTNLIAETFKEWGNIKENFVRNSFSSYVHFLPSDEQSLIFSGLSSHSLVLFRYPMTVSVEILDLAGTSTEVNWHHVVNANLSSVPFLENYRDIMPVKTISLRSEFLSDLLSRYVAVYNRIGSPDFTSASISRICEEVDL